jgi:hypothetical protein
VSLRLVVLTTEAVTTGGIGADGTPNTMFVTCAAPPGYEDGTVAVISAAPSAAPRAMRCSLSAPSLKEKYALALVVRTLFRLRYQTPLPSVRAVTHCDAPGLPLPLLSWSCR